MTAEQLSGTGVAALETRTQEVPGPGRGHTRLRRGGHIRNRTSGVQESHRLQGTGTGSDGSWPVGGKVGSADQVSAPHLVITEHTAQLPLACALVHFCLRTLQLAALPVYPNRSMGNWLPAFTPWMMRVGVEISQLPWPLLGQGWTVCFLRVLRVPCRAKHQSVALPWA